MSITKNELKDIKSLLSNKGRKTQKRFLAEGVRLLEEAIHHNFLPITVYIAPSVIASREKSLLIKMKKRNVNIKEISKKQLSIITGTENPQGIVAVFNIPVNKPTQHSYSNYRRILWCYDISDPGNLGTLIRSSLAFGFKLLILSGKTVDIYAPKVVRSTAGAVFGLTVIKRETDEILKFARERKLSIITADINGDNADYFLKKKLKNNRFILVIGSEAHGLPDTIKNNADFAVRIEHSDNVESLNAAVAGSIIMSNIYSFYESKK
ncbi:MAG: TrmH family RNA methyltransferase [Candidatus Zixiibacteriota bacterium]